jgi:hypothetical protein
MGAGIPTRCAPANSPVSPSPPALVSPQVSECVRSVEKSNSFPLDGGRLGWSWESRRAARRRIPQWLPLGEGQGEGRALFAARRTQIHPQRTRASRIERITMTEPSRARACVARLGEREDHPARQSRRAALPLFDDPGAPGATRNPGPAAISHKKPCPRRRAGEEPGTPHGGVQRPSPSAAPRTCSNGKRSVDLDCCSLQRSVSSHLPMSPGISNTPVNCGITNHAISDLCA